MTSDDLSYSDIVAEASRKAAGYGLLTSDVKRDESLFVSITDNPPRHQPATRREVTFWTSGTGAFLVDLDQRWTWQTFAYHREDQLDAVRDIIRLARHYLSGAGQENHTQLVLVIDTDRIVLQAHDERGDRAPVAER